MRKLTLISSIFLAVAFVSSCKKDKGSTVNQLQPLSGNWKNSSWGGVPGNEIVLRINETTANGVIQSIGSQTFNFSVGETILSNITPSSGVSVFNCNAIFKYGSGNQNVASTTAVITLQNNNQQISIEYAPANGIAPPTYVYVKQ